MKLSKKKALKLHRELWNWLAKNPEKVKYEWPRWVHNKGDIPEMSNECFLCEYAAYHGGCLYGCPVDCSEYGDPRKDDCLGGLFNKYCDEGSFGDAEVRSHYAECIRDLPERKGV
jgi:hypothetical protein